MTDSDPRLNLVLDEDGISPVKDQHGRVIGKVVDGHLDGQILHLTMELNNGQTIGTSQPLALAPFTVVGSPEITEIGLADG